MTLVNEPFDREPGETTAAHKRGVERRQPPWTPFLTPAAILIGALLISATIWWLDDEPVQPPSAPAGSATPVTDGGASLAATPSAASGAQNLLAAFTGYAQQLGIDTARFQACLGRQANVDLINRHLQRGNEFGVTGTPTFVINNKLLVGAQPAAIFDEIIRLELSGSPTSLDAYSANVRALAGTSPPRFQILDRRPDVSDTFIEGGGAQAKVMVAEFSDFQCPFCKRWGDSYLGTLRTKYPDVALAFLHFPITQIHPNAANASVAAICAGEQGRFWEMHDLLFARQQEWERLPN